MSATTTPEGTTIIHALALGRIVAQRAAQVPFAPSRLKVPAKEFEAAFDEAKAAVVALEGLNRRVTDHDLADAIVESLRDMTRAGMLDGFEEHVGFPTRSTLGARTMKVDGEIDVLALVFLIRQKLQEK